MEWQFDSSAPIYAQLVDGIKLGIVSGELPPGARLLAHAYAMGFDRDA